MGGFGGGSSTQTDRGNILSGTQGLWNVFNQGLGLSGQQNQTGQQQQFTGQQNLNQSTDYWTRLLKGGRTDTAQLASPATNAVNASSDAQRQQQAQFGSGRSGGTASQAANADTARQSSVDQIINQNLIGGRQAGAQGLEQAGATELATGATSLQQALSALGIGESASANILNAASSNYKFNAQQQQQFGESLGSTAATLALAFLG